MNKDWTKLVIQTISQPPSTDLFKNLFSDSIYEWGLKYVISSCIDHNM